MTRLTPADRAEIARRYVAGESAASIAREFGCSTATSSTTCERPGCQLLDPPSHPSSSLS